MSSRLECEQMQGSLIITRCSKADRQEGETEGKKIIKKTFRSTHRCLKFTLEKRTKIWAPGTVSTLSVSMSPTAIWSPLWCTFKSNQSEFPCNRYTPPGPCRLSTSLRGEFNCVSANVVQRQNVVPNWAKYIKDTKAMVMHHTWYSPIIHLNWPQLWSTRARNPVLTLTINYFATQHRKIAIWTTVYIKHKQPVNNLQ